MRAIVERAYDLCGLIPLQFMPSSAYLKTCTTPRGRVSDRDRCGRVANRRTRLGQRRDQLRDTDRLGDVAVHSDRGAALTIVAERMRVIATIA